MKYIEGDLITLGKNGQFEVITHSCNCFSKMGRGIAPQMAKEFGCDKFPMEKKTTDKFLKLGNIDWDFFIYGNHELAVVNSYAQYHWSEPSKYGFPADYDSLTLCLRKINFQFPNLRVGLPKICAGLAGGDWNKIEKIIQDELFNCDVTIVIYNK